MARSKIGLLKAILVAIFEEAVFFHTRTRKAGVRKEDALRVFNADAVDYDSKYAQYTRDTHPVVLAEIEKTSFDSILDVSCGNGILLSTISGDVKKTGLDISPKMIQMAKRKTGNSADLVVGDSEMLPYTNGSFDVVVCVLAFHHFEQPEIAVREMHRVLRKVGRIIICDVYEPIFWRRLYGNILLRAFRGSGDVHVYSEKEIQWLLKRAGFRTIAWKKVGGKLMATSVRI